MIEYTVRVYPTKVTYWFLDGKCHREDGPAVEYFNGSKYWYINDKLHREDGPAIEYSNGDKCWYLDNKKLTEAEHKAATSRNTCEGKIIEIDGKKYQLKEV